MSQFSPGFTPMSRRAFVARLGQYGGSAISALSALGLMSRASGQGVALEKLDSVPTDKSAKVIILGAGVAGMCAAYELEKLGIDSIIIEPAAKAGGRCLTVRGGDKIVETTGASQTCEFDKGQYFNPGPSRFPQWHITMDYCRELGVEIQPFVNLNENAFYYTEGDDRGPLSGKRVRIREAKTDLRGYMAELLSKVVDQEALDAPMTAEDITKLKDYLTYEGGLNRRSKKYEGHARRGYEEWPGGGFDEGKLADPYALQDLIQAGYGNYFHRANEVEYMSQMYTPVGGMDKIATAFESKVGSKINYGAKALEIRHRSGGGSRIVYEQDGEKKEIEGDYCICTIPPTILRKLQTDLPMQMSMALNVVPFQNSGKIGLQFKRRFWEEDDQIYGGISWNNLPIGETWYPSAGFFGKKGIMVGYYIFGPIADQVGRMSPAKRIEFALSHGEKIHPQYREEFENAIAFNWATMPNIEGCLAHFPKAMIKTFYPMLINGDRETFIAASWASHVGGWQAGAFEAARFAVKKVYDRVQAA